MGGTISGLTASGLVLNLNAGSGLTLSVASGSTTFIFPTPLTNNVGYNVSINTQPTGQTCTPSSNSGTIASANITNVLITCVTNTPTTVAGSISGLTTSGLKLTLHSYSSTGVLTQLEELTVASGSSNFIFATTFTSVTTVTIRVSSQPTGLTCIIASPAGVVGSSTNLNIAQVKCATRTTNTLTGTYRLSAVNGVSFSEPVFITLYDDGSYVFAAHNSTDGADAEYGIYNWTQSSGAFTTQLVAVDTNTNTGIGSDPSCCTRTVSVSGATLTLVVTENSVTDTYTLTAATNVSGSLTGSWLFPNSPNAHDFIVFLSNGTYMWSTTSLLTTLTSSNSVLYNGIENACYTATSSVISPTLSGCYVVPSTSLAGVNANGNPGFILNNGTISAPASYSVSGDTMTWTSSTGVTTPLTRITN